MNGINKNFYAVITADVLYDKNLSIRQKLLIALINNLSNEKGYCWASNAFFAEILAVEERTIQRDISELEEKHILNRVINVKPNGDFDFRALVYIGGGMTQQSPPPDSHVTTPPDTGVTIITKSINNNNNINTSSFLQFWEGYNKKVERKDCENIWSKISQVNISKIFEVLPKYIESTPDVKYRKNPATWLRGECWNDVIVVTKKQQSVSDKYSNIIERIKL
jgi:hypothetical protein